MKVAVLIISDFNSQTKLFEFSDGQSNLFLFVKSNGFKVHQNYLSFQVVCQIICVSKVKYTFTAVFTKCLAIK